MDLGLADRVFILTGASRGLGFATARALVDDGARVVISSRNAEQVAEAVAELGPNAAGLAADLADDGTPRELVDTALERFGRLDGALISVGGPTPGTAASIDDAQWRAAFETVFLGSVRTARTVANALPEGGAIALVLSTSVKTPLAGLGVSSGFRPGLAMVAKDMADEFGPRGVRVLSILPGRFMTARSRELFEATDDPAAATAEVIAAIPLRRIAEPIEFGRAAAFLLSPAASFVTGCVVPVDGGSLRTL
ncbi:SDR family oxidoreductase [Actinoplanes sp. NPDC051851]|uniref:SDR family oxidoreductase n=1 Tax=Actinoplanes sp. NPDC051851 TaxID=3154753 RepID=UPI003418C773